MKSAIGLSLLLIGLAMEWVAIHGYTAPAGTKGFGGLVQGFYDAMNKVGS